MEVEGSGISKYGVVVPIVLLEVFLSWLKAKASEAPSNLASIGRYILTQTFLNFAGLSIGSRGEIQLADAINIHAQKGLVGVVRLNGLRFDCGSVEGFVKATTHEFGSRGLA